ncbi:gp4.15 [Salmonella phage phiSG-JL2]|uniref:Gp4.15 n=1 Tax=Salmonella phage phiSG-JL2 TaxID=529929 RepID=B3FYJ2_9CAUD|nr:gp4.15 [Salmonella phage phiSG-JL2]ACD75684.1 gp4.15 [Salmonella phage phiSG-JL2]
MPKGWLLAGESGQPNVSGCLLPRPERLHRVAEGAR